VAGAELGVKGACIANFAVYVMAGNGVFADFADYELVVMHF